MTDKVTTTKLDNGDLELRSTDFAEMNHICFLNSHAIIDKNTIGVGSRVYSIVINDREILLGSEYEVKESWAKPSIKFDSEKKDVFELGGTQFTIILKKL